MAETNQVIFTAEGPIRAPEFAALKAGILKIPCTGNACANVQDKFSGRIVVLRNIGGDTIAGKIVWGSVFGTCDLATPFTLFPGEIESYPFPNSGILGVCNIEANIY
jgi:hypothetical protein